jgi:hypothetical protein
LGGALFEVVDDLRHPEHAHGKRGEADALGERGKPEREAYDSRIHVGADDAQQQAEHDHGDRLADRSARQHHRADEAEHHQREVVGGLEFESDFRQWRREQGNYERCDAAGDEGCDRRHPERRSGAALLGHRMAVDGRHHRGGLTRDVDEDRGGRAAILRAVIDAGQHDQRGCRTEAECQWQQHRDRRDRADAGQHADQGAEKHPDETVGQVVRRDGDAEPEGEIGEDVHL